LPLTKRWRATFIVLRAVVISAAATAVLLFLVLQVVPASWAPSVLGLAGGAFAVFAVIGLLYSAMRPKGTIHADARNQSWILLSDVHPNFVSAVEAMEAGAVNSQEAPSEQSPGI